MRPTRIILCVVLLSFLAAIFNMFFYRLQRNKIQTNTGSQPSSSRQPENNAQQSKASTANEGKYTKESLKNRTVLSKGCEPRNCQDPSEIPTSFKIYVYDLPPYFNTDIQRFLTDTKKFSYCFNLDYCGMGEELLQIDNRGRQIVSLEAERLKQWGTLEFNVSSLGKDSHLTIQSIRNTHQFALEVIIHCKLLHSPHRTLIPDEADIFYIPVYAGLNCISERNNNTQFVDELFDFMHTNEHVRRYYTSGKPHFTTVSKIQREMAERGCPILRHPDSRNITFIAIEKERNPSWLMQKHIYGRSILVAPYPSYVHCINISDNTTKFENSTLNSNISLIHLPSLETKNILLFLAASNRRSNPFRAKILDQFHIKTMKNPNEFFSRATPDFNIDQIMLVTSECSPEHRSSTVPWMRRSTYCLQPPGDSSTRKSIYDSISSGCIPVLFKGPYKTEYPFQKVLNYEKFTYTIDDTLLTKSNRTVREILKEISPQKTRMLHEHLRHVAKWFQYSVPNGEIQWQKDALTMILDELAHKYKL